MLKRAEGLRAASTKVEGSLHVRPVPGPLPRSNWLKPVPNGRTYRGKARHCLAVRVSRSPGCLRLSRGTQVGRQAPAPESPSPPRGASPVRPAERPLRAAHRRPSRPSPVPGAAHLSELPGVPPRPRQLRAPLPCSGSSPVPEAAGSPLPGSRGRSGRGGPRSESGRSRELRTKPAPAPAAAPRPLCPHRARRAARGQAQEMTSAAAASHRGARPGPPAGLRAATPGQLGPSRDAPETGPFPGRRARRVSNHLYESTAWLWGAVCTADL